MSIFLSAAVLLLCCARICLCQFSTEAGSISVEERASAVVVFKAGERVYLSSGRLDGVSSNWIVCRVQSGPRDLREPLTWIGDDLCRIEPDAALAREMRIGDTVWLASVELHYPGSTGGSIRWAVTSLPLSVDQPPVTMIDWDFREAVYDHHGELIERIEPDESGNSVWYLHTDKESRFSSGERVDADAVIESLKWLCGSRQPFHIWLEHFELIRDTLYCAKANPFKIQTNFPGYCGREYSYVDDPGFYLFGVEGRGERLAGHAQGSGTYRIAEASDTSMILCRQGGASGLALVDTVFLQFYDSYESAKQAFELGEADVIDIAPYDVRRFEDHYEVVSDTLNAAVFLSVNNTRPYFADNLFAAAVNYLIDRESLCRVPLAQMVEQIDFAPTPTGHRLRAPFTYDPQKGRRLLRQIDGLPKYMSLLVTDPTDPAMSRAAQYIRGVLARENVSVTIYPGADSEEDGSSGALIDSYDMMIARLNDPAGTPARILYQSYYHSQFDKPESNRSLFHSSELDQAFGDYFSNCFDQTEEGVEAMARIVYIHLNAPSGVWLYKPIRYVAVSRRIISLRFSPDGVVDIAHIRLE